MRVRKHFDSDPAHTRRWYKIHRRTSITIIFLCILFVVVCAGVIKGRSESGQREGGWRREFDGEISQQIANPGVFHTMTVNGSSLYIGTVNGTTHSFNRTTGALQWRYEAQDYSIYQAAFDGLGNVFTSNFDGGVYAIDQKSGAELWRFRIPEYFKVDTEPIASDGFVYFGGRNGVLYALSETTGKVQWSFEGAPLDTTHVLGPSVQHFGRFSVDDKNIYLNSANTDTIYALDKKTGKEIWRFAKYGFVFQKPAIFPDSVSIENKSGVYYLLDKTSGSVLYSQKMLVTGIVRGNAYIYTIAPDHSVESVNTANGKSQWIFKRNGFQPTQLKEVVPSRLIMMGKNNAPESIATRIIVVDTATGKELWTQVIEEPLINSIASDLNNVYIIGQEIQCAYTIQGQKIWCSHEHQNEGVVIPGQDCVYFVSDDREHTDISCMNPQTGSRKWTYKLPTTRPSVMETYKGDLYFVSLDKKSVHMLSGKFSQPVMHDDNIDSITREQSGVPQTDLSVPALVQQLQGSFVPVAKIQSLIKLDPPDTQSRLNEPFELTVRLDDTKSSNRYDDIKITGTFSYNETDTYTVRAFYFDKNTWKIRFVPNRTGRWNFSIQYDASNTILNRGSFDVSTSDAPGFIAISKKDPRLFTTYSGNVFIPIGIQDCVRDVNQDGNPLNQWFPGTKSTPLAITFPQATSTMDSYISLYAESGFNMFRWGAENCSFPLWKTLSPSGNRYALAEGFWLDTLFTSLRKHGFHVWMSLFSFQLPLEKTLTETQKQTVLSRYLDYVVARYTVYVDVWELANEIKLDDNLINFMSDYIRKIDPYHHPITTSWERPNLPSIDITSAHWYSQECDEFCNNELNVQTEKLRLINKPLVYSEQGNWFANWDKNSAARLRIRLWIGYFEKIFFIFWNTSNDLFVNKKGPSNIYIGPIERQYISVFHTLTSDQSDSLTPFPLESEDKAYAFQAGKQIIGYLYRSISAEDQKNAYITMNVPEKGTIQWISPTTGSVLSEQAVEKGSQALVGPQFSSDVVFKIIFN